MLDHVPLLTLLSSALERSTWWKICFCTNKACHKKTNAHSYPIKEEEEEEEMRSPGRAPPLASPMVHAGPHRLGEAAGGGVALIMGLPGSA